MRVRALDDNGDYSFGQGSANFLVNSPGAVGQVVETRLLLLLGEWFVDTTDGTPYLTQVFTEGGRLTADQAIRARILGTQGVTGIESYSSTILARRITISATIDTIYGQTAVEVAL